MMGRTALNHVDQVTCEHVCKPAEPVCECWLLADAPADDCPIHGGGVVNRCECGRFISLRPVENPTRSIISNSE